MKKRSAGIVISYIYTFLNMICSLVMSSFLLRMLGDTEYGLYQTVSAFATYLVMLEFGTGTVMSRNISLCRGRGDEENLKHNTATLWYTAIGLSTLILIVSIVFCCNIGTVYKATMSVEQVGYAQKIFVVMTAYLIVSFFTNTLNGFLLGVEHYTFANTVNVIKVITRTLLLLLLIFLKPYAILIAGVDLFISIGVFVATFICCKCKFKINLNIKNFKKSILVESLPLCLALLLQALINQANSSVGKFVIGIKLTLESVALYSIVQYIYTLISTITTIPISMYLPQIAKNMARGIKEKELTKILVQPCRLVVLIGGTLLFGFVAVGKQFITIFYGESKQAAWIYALIIAIPMFVNMTNGVIINVLDVSNKRLVRSLSLAATAVLNILITLYLIPDYGILGVVIGTASSLIVGNILVMNIYYKKALKLNVIWLFIQAYKGILPFQILAGLVSFFVTQLIQNVYLSFFAGGLIYVFIAALCIFSFGLNASEKDMILSVVDKIKKKFL